MNVFIKTTLILKIIMTDHGANKQAGFGNELNKIPHVQKLVS